MIKTKNNSFIIFLSKKILVLERKFTYINVYYLVKIKLTKF